MYYNCFEERWIFNIKFEEKPFSKFLSTILFYNNSHYMKKKIKCQSLILFYFYITF